MKRKISMLLAAAISLSFMTACGNTNASESAGISENANRSERTNTPGESSASDQEEGGSAYPMTFDNYGREVTVAENRREF